VNHTRMRTRSALTLAVAAACLFGSAPTGAAGLAVGDKVRIRFLADNKGTVLRV